MTGINFLNQETTAKGLGLLHDLVPNAVRIAVLVNPANAPDAESTARDMPEAARALGLQIAMLKASTGRDIESGLAAIIAGRNGRRFNARICWFSSEISTYSVLRVFNEHADIRTSLLRSV